MSTYDQIAQMPDSCGLMDAKSGKSFLVNGRGSGNDPNSRQWPGIWTDKKKSHAYSNQAIQVMNAYDPNSPITWVMDAWTEANSSKSSFIGNW